jgi:hypothetical protein
MGGHGWTFVMLWWGLGGHRLQLMVMVWVWVQIGRKMLGSGENGLHAQNTPTILSPVVSTIGKTYMPLLRPLIQHEILHFDNGIRYSSELRKSRIRGMVWIC